MSFKDFLTGLSLKRAPGPSPSFSVLDVIRLLRLLAERGVVGRGGISRALGLGEGTTRTMLDRLEKAGLIVISKKGCMLTEKGKSIWGSIEEIIPKIVELKDIELGIASENVAILVRGRGEKIKSGIEQRDAAVSSGAKGTVTIVCRDSRLIIPGVNIDVEESYPRAFERIMRLMDPRDGDVIIVSGGDTLRSAEYGALAAALSLI